MKSAPSTWPRCVALGFLLLFETGWLLSSFPVERSALQSALLLPWGHLMLGFGLYLGVASLAGGGVFNRLATLQIRLQTSLLPLGIHLGYFGCLLWGIPHLWAAVPMGADPAGRHYAALLPWLGMVMGFFASWAACLVSVRYWPGILRQGGHVLVGGSALSALAYWVGQSTIYVWDHLAGVTFVLVFGLLTRLGIPAHASATGLGLHTPTFDCEIAPGCSGFEGIGLVAVFTLAYLWLGRDHLRFPRAFFLLPIGMLVIWLTNVVRLALLVIVGSYLSPYIAVNGFHSNFGWLMFALVSLGLIYVSERTGWLSSQQEKAARTRYPPAAYLVPMLTLLVMMLVCQTFSLTFDDTYPLRMVVLLIPLWVYRRQYQDWRFSVSGAAIAVGLLVFVLWLMLEPPSTGTVESPFSILPYGMAVGWLVVRLLGSSLLIPLTEELAFKGFLLRRLVSAQFESVPFDRFTLLSFVGSSLAFGVMHQRWLAACIAGSMYTLLLYRRGNLWDAVQAHAVTNFCLGVYAIYFGQWSLWS